MAAMSLLQSAKAESTSFIVHRLLWPGWAASQCYNASTLSKNFVIRAFLLWLPFAVTITLFCLLVDGAVQHDIRIGADDPQIQMAEDTASALASGGQPTSLPSRGPVDISKSLAPYLIVYDSQGQILASSASLHGARPVLPEGVFADVAKHGEARFTWQPAPGVRQAVVVTRYSGATPGFVLAGRSIREVESREDDLNAEVIVAWAISLAGTFVVLSAVLVLLRWSPFRASNQAA